MPAWQRNSWHFVAAPQRSLTFRQLAHPMLDDSHEDHRCHPDASTRAEANRDALAAFRYRSPASAAKEHAALVFLALTAVFDDT